MRPVVGERVEVGPVKKEAWLGLEKVEVLEEAGLHECCG